MTPKIHSVAVVKHQAIFCLLLETISQYVAQREFAVDSFQSLTWFSACCGEKGHLLCTCTILYLPKKNTHIVRHFTIVGAIFELIGLSYTVNTRKHSSLKRPRYNGSSSSPSRLRGTLSINSRFSRRKLSSVFNSE